MPVGAGDLLLYENAIIFAGASDGAKADKTAFLQASELVKIGDTWKFVDLPRAINPANPAPLIAMEGGNRLGAAWLRLFPASAPGYGFVDEQTPELTISVVPSRRCIARGRSWCPHPSCWRSQAEAFPVPPSTNKRRKKGSSR